jgi:hypothetical protein
LGEKGVPVIGVFAVVGVAVEAVVGVGVAKGDPCLDEVADECSDSYDGDGDDSM